MTDIEQPKVQYEIGESLLLGQRAKVMPYPFVFVVSNLWWEPSRKRGGS